MPERQNVASVRFTPSRSRPPRTRPIPNRLGIGLGDEPTLDRLDDAARALALARGPIGSADLVTVLAAQVATLASIIAGPHGDPEAMYTGLIRDQVDLARRQRDAEKSISE
ncbi:hypothetical protein [Streptomyces sp. NPDC059970]|uniref:hypothetical protein n=1 Tax=Streptomyces sp. NPDC059970 TaxID=3347019 RepID=UPI0036B5A647